MKYNEFIEVNQGFQASVNLEYDLNKIDRIEGYIPTEQSVKLLGGFLRSFYYNTDSQSRATVLIGPYGRGKSHLLLVLSALTSLDCFAQGDEEKNAARKIQVALCNKISRVNAEIGALSKAIVDSDIRTLPVIINSNTPDINQSFLVALSEALTRAHLEGLLPNTYFDSALSVIEKWEANYPDAIQKLKAELRKRKERLDTLKIGLKQFDHKAYKLFCESYPLIAAGTEFNPLTNMDVVRLYITVSNALREQTSYTGISIIFDEFSKFLEANLDKSRMLNFKIIQDMAEAAVRSKEAQLHFTCITHKDILDYSTSDSFKTVEGRFKKLRFVSSSEQSYELIANAIPKMTGFHAFKAKYDSEFKKVAARSAMTAVFSDLTTGAYEEKLVCGCFPLAPLSSFSLLHVSELVGQNERTLFTFLAQPGEKTLRAFIDTDVHGIQWITVDYIYDYFEPLFKQEVFNSSVHSVWAKTDSALLQVSVENERRILKAIAILSIIGDERLRPVPAHLKAALILSDDEFDRDVKALLKKHIISQRDSSEFVLLTANGVDVQRSVDQYVKTTLTSINICDTLSKACDLGFILPREYNDKYGLQRCFKCIYMEAKSFVSFMRADQIMDQYPYDGLVINLICQNEMEREAAVQKMKAFTDNRQIVLCTTTHPFVYERLLKQFEAAERLLQTTTDTHFLEELEVLLEDLEKRIQSAVYTMYAPSSEFSAFYTSRGHEDISKQADLNRLVSRACSQCFSMTPVVNNEMVNKSNLNSQNTKARDAVAAWVLQHSEDAKIPCMQGFGPEVSIFKSAFKHTGLDAASEVEDKGMNYLLGRIANFVQESENNKRSFQGLYQELTSPPIGLRKGIIPLYLAYVLRQFKESAIFYFKGKEVELSANLLGNLNNNPENYEILIERGTAEKRSYLDALQELFEGYSDPNTAGINRVYSIVKSMQIWIRSLPDYTKKYRKYTENSETRGISPELEAMRNELLKFEINSRELLFFTWPSRMSLSGNLSDCVSVIRSSKAELDNHLNRCRKELIKQLTVLFAPGYQGGMSRAAMAWYDALPSSTKTHVFDSTTNSLLNIAATISTYDDEALLDSLIMSFVSIAIEDWNDGLADAFIDGISQAIRKVNDYVSMNESSSQGGKLLISVNGTQVEKTFAAETISPLGKTAYNNLKAVFEEYNEAIAPDEQLAILAKLIGEIIQ